MEQTVNNVLTQDRSLLESEFVTQVIIICSIVIFLILIGTLVGTLLVRYQRKKRYQEFRAMESGRLTEEEEEFLRESFISPDEMPLYYLGQDLVEDYLKSEENTEDWENGCRGDGLGEYGFSYLTDKRIYFKGKHYYQGRSGRIGSTKQPETYDRREIVSFREVNQRPIWPVVATAVLTVIEIAGLVVLYLVTEGKV